MNDLESRERRRFIPERPSSNGDLPEHRQKQVEAGLAQYQAILAEREDLHRKLVDATVKIGALEKKLDAMQGHINMLESTVQTHQLHRDEAVTKTARLSTVIDSIAVMIANEVYDPRRDGDVQNN